MLLKFFRPVFGSAVGILTIVFLIVALCIWVFVMGGPFVQLSWYNAEYGKLLVVLYTFFVPIFYKPERLQLG